MVKMYIATTNEGKIKELTAAFVNQNVEFIPLEVNFDELEDGMKKDEIRDMILISKAKAKAAFEFLKRNRKELLPVLVDDAGIYFEKLGDRPGIDTKYFLKKQGGIEGVKKIISEGDKAYFQCVISYMDETLVESKSFIGKTQGRLSSKDDAVEIEGGMPFNHVFIPDGYDKFMYKISLEERAKFSHRFRAVEKLKKYIESREGEHKVKFR